MCTSHIFYVIVLCYCHVCRYAAGVMLLCAAPSLGLMVAGQLLQTGVSNNISAATGTISSSISSTSSSWSLLPHLHPSTLLPPPAAAVAAGSTAGDTGAAAAAATLRLRAAGAAAAAAVERISGGTTTPQDRLLD